MSQTPEDKKREETRAKLKEFLRSGDSEDVTSVLVHTLMHRADVTAESNKTQEDKKTQPPTEVGRLDRQ